MLATDAKLLKRYLRSAITLEMLQKTGLMTLSSSMEKHSTSPKSQERRAETVHCLGCEFYFAYDLSLALKV
jgi:hypothetical protein